MTDRPLSNPPFFIVGSLRSGTTLLRLMLGHHSKICRCEEMDYVTAPIAEMRARTSDAEHYRQYLGDSVGFRLSGYTIPVSDSFAEVATDFLRQRQDIDGRPFVGATVHHHFEWLPELWPMARYIHLVRDPRDVAPSCVQMGWHGTPWRAAKIWNAAHDSWTVLKSQTSADQRMELSFENLVADPERSLALICNFIGVEFEASMLSIDRDTTYSRPSARAAKSWRDSCSKDHIAQVEDTVGNRLVIAGYTPSGYPALKTGPRTRLRLAIQDILNRMRFRWKRYGLLLWLGELAARRARLSYFHKKLKRRVDEIDVRHHK